MVGVPASLCPPVRVSDARLDLFWLIFLCPEQWLIPGLELMRVQSTNWSLNQQAFILDLAY